MQAWQIERLGGASAFNDVPMPEVRAGSVLVRIEASALMSYLKDYVEGKLPVYDPPEGWFTPGGNAVGTVAAVGQDVWHVRPGIRVLISSHIVADERVDEPGQMLLGITAPGPAAKPIQNDWRDGTLAEYVLVPKSIVTSVQELDSYGPAQLAALVRFAVCTRPTFSSSSRLSFGTVSSTSVLFTREHSPSNGFTTRWRPRRQPVPLNASL